MIGARTREREHTIFVPHQINYCGRTTRAHVIFQLTHSSGEMTPRRDESAFRTIDVV